MEVPERVSATRRTASLKLIQGEMVNSVYNSPINRVLGGESLVIQGPPGTGKSQTIANLIGNYIANYKSLAANPSASDASCTAILQVVASPMCDGQSLQAMR